MKNNKLKISVDPNVYPLDAVKASAYTFTNIAFVEIKRITSKKIEVVLTLKDNKKLSSVKLKGEFLNELLHHSLRQKISENNKSIREYIVTQALASANPIENKLQYAQTADCGCQNENLESEIEAEIKKVLAETDKNYQNDPLNISKTWEETHKGKSTK